MKILKRILLNILFVFALAAISFFGVTFFEEFVHDVDIEKVNEVFLEDTHYMYHYSKFDEEDKDTYKRLYYSFKTFNKEITIYENDLETAKKVYYAVMDDHPELYYIDGEFEYVIGTKLRILPHYVYNQQEVEEYDKQITKVTEDIVKKAKKEKDEISKVEMLYNYIIENTAYNHNENDQNMLSVFIDNESVCAGYARSYQYLLSQVGIDSSYIGGETVEKEDEELTGHAWLMIHMNDNYYYSDPTWGDVDTKNIEHSCKEYFLMSSDEMLKCYTPDLFYEETVNDDNYFKMSGTFMKNYDRDILSKAVKIGLENKTRVAEVQCADKKVFDQVKNNLKNNYLGYRVLKENNCYSKKATYVCEEADLMIKLFY